MGAYQFVCDGYVNTTGSFQRYVGQCHNIILRAGFVDMSASNAFDGTNGPTFANLGGTAALNTVPRAAFKVYKFNDPLSASAPVYFKLEWGSSNNNGGATWITVGTQVSGTNPNDVTASNNSGRFQIANNGNIAVSGAATAWFIGADGTSSVDPYITFMSPSIDPLNNNSVVDAFTWGIQRTLDATGSATSGGIMLVVANPAGNRHFRAIPVVPSGSNPTADADATRTYHSAIGILRGNANCNTLGGKIVIAPAFTYPGFCKNPLTLFLVVGNAAIRQLDPIAIPIYSGKPYTYINSNVFNAWNVSGQTNQAWAMKWS